LPLGAAGELSTTLERMRRRGHTRCVLGLRDLLQDPETVRETWADRANLAALHDYYSSIWIYGDPTVIDTVREYDVFNGLAKKVRYTGYLDQRERLAFAQAEELLSGLPPGKLALCLLGGGHDGGALAEAFAAAKLP